MEITLTQGKNAILDYDDWKKLKSFNWFAQKCGSNRYYARRNIKIGDGKQKQINMHHVIMGTPPIGLQIDHINGNPLDNRKCNLRFVTARQNQQNQVRLKTSRFPGVYFYKVTKKWKAQIKINGKRKGLGYYEKEEDAFLAYNRAINDLNEVVIC